MKNLKTALKALHDGDAPLLAAMPGWYFIDHPASPSKVYGLVRPIVGEMEYSSVNRMETIPLQIDIIGRSLAKVAAAADALYAVFDDGVLTYPAATYSHNYMRRTGWNGPTEANRVWRITVDYIIERIKAR